MEKNLEKMRESYVTLSEAYPIMVQKLADAQDSKGIQSTLDEARQFAMNLNTSGLVSYDEAQVFLQGIKRDAGIK